MKENFEDIYGDGIEEEYLWDKENQQYMQRSLFKGKWLPIKVSPWDIDNPEYQFDPQRDRTYQDVVLKPQSPNLYSDGENERRIATQSSNLHNPLLSPDTSLGFKPPAFIYPQYELDENYVKNIEKQNKRSIFAPTPPNQLPRLSVPKDAIWKGIKSDMNIRIPMSKRLDDSEINITLPEVEISIPQKSQWNKYPTQHITSSAQQAVEMMTKEHGSSKAVCNFGTQRALELITEKKMLPGMANDMVRQMEESPDWIEVSISEAQSLANEGHLVIAGYYNNTGKSGHVGLVVPGKETYSSNWKRNLPRTMNTGSDYRTSDQMLSEGFGYNKKDKVKIFVKVK